MDTAVNSQVAKSPYRTAARPPVMGRGQACEIEIPGKFKIQIQTSGQRIHVHSGEPDEGLPTFKPIIYKNPESESGSSSSGGDDVYPTSTSPLRIQTSPPRQITSSTGQQRSPSPVAYEIRQTYASPGVIRYSTATPVTVTHVTKKTGSSMANITAQLPSPKVTISAGDHRVYASELPPLHPQPARSPSPGQLERSEYSVLPYSRDFLRHIL